ncbi:hypothetical protein [Methylocapsa sp. S129]|uniref:hypothetical protein n=1 Tax=Methylocapsa sp. S129 TaxID=1641869 RepID=UPI00131BE472|nr:hypothetical protein [Methylocapsa sp. S129]
MTAAEEVFLDDVTPPKFSRAGSEVRTPSHRDEMQPDKFAALFLSLVRFIGAGYAHGDAECWEAAHRCAEEAVGPIDGPLFVARAAGLVRAVRRRRDPDLAYLPWSCLRLSSDEAKLMLLIGAARATDMRALERAASDLLGGGRGAETIQAANELANLCRRPAAR